MSSDNGYIIRKAAGMFWLDMYFVSADRLPPVRQGQAFPTLSEACVEYAKLSKNPNFASEYGLRIDLDDPDEPDWYALGTDPSNWARAFFLHVKDYNLETMTIWFEMAMRAGGKRELNLLREAKEHK